MVVEKNKIQNSIIKKPSLCIVRVLGIVINEYLNRIYIFLKLGF